MESSWVEQRRWGIENPLEALGLTHPLAQSLQAEFAAMRPVMPDPSGSRGIQPQAPVLLGGWANVTVGHDGSIRGLVDNRSGRVWADAENPLAWARYQTLTLAEFNTWHYEYIVGANRTSASGSNEYGKPKSMMDAEPTPVAMLKAPKSVEAIWVAADEA